MPLPPMPAPPPALFSQAELSQRALPTAPPLLPGGRQPPKTVRIEDPNSRFSGMYDQAVIEDVIRGSQRADVNPLTGLAMALQESRLGNVMVPRNNTAANPLQYRPLKGDPGPLEGLKWQELPDEALRPMFIDAAFARMKANQRGVDPADEELMIQAHNGMGRPAGSSLYGRSSNLNGRVDRPYGKRVIELRESVIKPNAQLRGLIGAFAGGQ